MQKGEDPLVWIGRVDNVGNMLACLDIHKTEVMLRRQIVRHVTPKYDTERRALLGHRNLPGNELEEILRDRFAEIRTTKMGGCQHALFTVAQGHGGQAANITGGNGGSHRSITQNKAARGGGDRGGRGTQGTPD